MISSLIYKRWKLILNGIIGLPIWYGVNNQFTKQMFYVKYYIQNCYLLVK